MTMAAAASDQPTAEPDMISRFLVESVGHDIHLAWIIPDGGRGACGGQWFGKDVDAAAAWAITHNANGRNVYWTVNIVSPGLHKKPKKTDITSARFVHMDIDPPKDGSSFDRVNALAKIEILEPGFVIDSGGGLQAFWRLDDRCEDLALIEDINQKVRDLFSADACQNIDRLMRVPGTVNWPDAKKRARGRVPAIATIIRADTGETVRADQLKARFTEADGIKGGAPGPAASVLHELGITTMCQPLHRLLTATDPARRSEEVLHAAGEMLRRGFDEATIVRVLLDPALEVSGHCLAQPDPRRAAGRAIHRAREDGNGRGDGASSQEMSPGQPAYPAPLDLWARYEAPELPLRLLPQIIERFALRHAEMMGADPAGLAMAALAVCGAALTDDIAVQVKRHDPTWRESARLWVGLVGAPSMKKTPIMNAALRPLRRIDANLMRAYQAAQVEYEALSAKERKGVQRPRQERRIISDATVEAAQEVLKDSPRGVLSSQDELSGWFGAMDKYAPGKGSMADRAFWLQAFNGGPYSVSRIVRGSCYIPNCSVSLLGGIQPEPLRAIANDAHDDGLIQRLLPVILKTAGVGRDAPSDGVLLDYERLIERLEVMNAPPPRGIASLNSGMHQPALLFDDAARAVREQLEAGHLELVRALEGTSAKLAAHFGKYDGLFARLCVLWHCIEHADQVIPPAEIGEDVAKRVAEFMERFLRPSAVAFYVGLLGLSDGHETILELASYIVAKDLSEVKARDVQRSTQSFRHILADDFRRLCEKLEAFGWVERADPGPKSNTIRWIVNPAVHDQFAARGQQDRERRKAAREALRNALSV